MKIRYAKLLGIALSAKNKSTSPFNYNSPTHSPFPFPPPPLPTLYLPLIMKFMMGIRPKESHVFLDCSEKVPHEQKWTVNKIERN